MATRKTKRNMIKTGLMGLAVACGAGLVLSHEVYAKKPKPPVIVALEKNVADFIYDPTTVPSWYYDAIWVHDDKADANWINKEINVLQNLTNKQLKAFDQQVYSWNGHKNVKLDNLKWIVNTNPVVYELLEDDVNFQALVQDFFRQIGVKPPRSTGGVGSGNGNGGGNGNGNGGGHGDNDDHDRAPRDPDHRQDHRDDHDRG